MGDEVDEVLEFGPADFGEPRTHQQLAADFELRMQAPTLIPELRAQIAASEARASSLEAEVVRLRADLHNAGAVMVDAIRLAHHYGHGRGNSQTCEHDTCVIGWRIARSLLAQPAAGSRTVDNPPH
jgi:hypothetical protein